MPGSRNPDDPIIRVRDKEKNPLLGTRPILPGDRWQKWKDNGGGAPPPDDDDTSIIEAINARKRGDRKYSKKRYILPNLPGGGGGGGVAPDRPDRQFFADQEQRNSFARQKMPLRAFYGPRRLKGAYVRYYKRFPDGRKLVCYWWSWGPIDGLSNFKIENKAFGDLGLLPVTNYNLYLGGSSAADPLMLSYEPQWAYVDHPADVAQLVVMYPIPGIYFPSTINVDRIECDGRGLLVRDPVQDPTLATRYYSENPVLQILDFDCDTRFGGHFPVDRQDWLGSVIEARNDAAEDLGSGRLRYMPQAIELESEIDYEPAIEMLRGHCALNYNFSDGKKVWWIDKWRDAVSFTLTDEGAGANIVSSEPLSFKGAGEIPTRVLGYYTDSTADYKRAHVKSEHPDLASGNVDLVEWKFDFRGILLGDVAQRIVNLIRKRATVDQATRLRLFAEGLKLLPGSKVLVEKLTSHNWENVEVLVTDIEPTPDRSTWDATVEVWSDQVHDDALQVVTTYAPPANPSPYDEVPAPLSPAGQTDLIGGDGLIAVRGGVEVGWSPPEWPHALLYRVTAEVAGGSEVVVGDNLRSGPVFVPIKGEGNVNIRVYAIGAISLFLSVAIEGTVYPAVAFPAYDVLAPTINLSDQTLSWNNPEVRDAPLLGAALWSGTAAITSALVNDGDKATGAVTFAAGQTLKLDLGAGGGRDIREVRISASSASLSAASSAFTIQYSLDDVTYFATTGSVYLPRMRTAFVSNTDEVVLQWASSGGTPRYWMITSGAGVTVSEVQFAAFTGAWNDLSSINIYDTRSGTPLLLRTLNVGAYGANPLQIGAYITQTSSVVGTSISTTTVASLLIRTVNSAGVESVGVGATKATVGAGLPSTSIFATQGAGDILYQKTIYDSTLSHSEITQCDIDLSDNTLIGSVALLNAGMVGPPIATTTGVETLFNKDIDLGNNTLSGSIAQFNAALVGLDFATTSGVEVITGKTMDAGSNTFSNIPAVALADGTTGTGAFVRATAPDVTNLDVTDGALSVKSMRLVSFTFELRTNGSGVMEHRFMADVGTASLGNFVAYAISGASATHATTPSVAAGVAFTAGAGIDAAMGNRLLFDTAEQMAADVLFMGAVLENNTTGTAWPVLRWQVFGSNVNGTSRTRLALLALNNSGAGIAFNTTNIPAGTNIRVRFYGHLYI